jgi:hypothetical protein
VRYLINFGFVRFPVQCSPFLTNIFVFAHYTLSLLVPSKTSNYTNFACTDKINGTCRTLTNSNRWPDSTIDFQYVIEYSGVMCVRLLHISGKFHKLGQCKTRAFPNYFHSQLDVLLTLNVGNVNLSISNSGCTVCARCMLNRTASCAQS